MRLPLLVVSIAALLAACTQQASDGPAESTSPPVVDTPAPIDSVAPVAPPPGTAGEQGGTDDWRSLITAEDAGRIGRLDQAWRLARAEAEDGGLADQVEALGPLVDPNAGQAGRLPPAPGAYRCRTFHLGANRPGGLAYVAYGWFRCSVELTAGGDLILTKDTGSQRTRGLLYPDTDRRLVFVGAAAWGDEGHYPNYGQTPERDQVGVMERIGPDRWRLVLPWPKQDAKLKIMEIAR